MSSLMRFDLAPHSLQFLAGGSYPAERTHRVFQVRDRSAGGKVHVEKLGIEVSTRVLTFKLMPKIDYEALISWFVNVAGAGDNPFDFTDEYGDVGEVLIMSSEIKFLETSFERYSGTLPLEYTP